MASWTDQDVAYLKKNPHLWRRFEAKFGALPPGFKKPKPRDIDIDYLRSNPAMAPKFEAAFGYLPEGIEAPAAAAQTAAPAPQLAEEVIPPPEAADIEPPPPLAEEDFAAAVKRAPRAWRDYQLAGQMPGVREPGIVDVPEPFQSEELRSVPHAEEGSIVSDFYGKPGYWLQKFGQTIMDGFGKEEGPAEPVESPWPPRDAQEDPGKDTVPRKVDRSQQVTTDPDEELDGMGMAILKGISIVPKQFLLNWIGFEAKYAADKNRNWLRMFDQLSYLAYQEGKSLVDSSAVQAIASTNGVTPEDIVEDLFTYMELTAATEEEKLEAARKKNEEIQKASPKTKEGSLQFYAGAITQAGAFMGPALLGGIVTRNPNMTLAMMGTQVWGMEYAQAREDGRTHEQATYDAHFRTAFEVVAERTPVSTILGPAGSGLLKKILKAGATEGMEEMLTEALNMGYDLGVIGDEMTLGEAMVRLKHAGIIGAGLGVTMAGAMHPLVKDSADPKDVPPHAREMVEAHQQLKEVVERSMDPAQKVTKAELEEAKARFQRAQDSIREAEENPEYAAALNEAAEEVRAAEQEWAKARRRLDAGMTTVDMQSATKMVRDAEARLKKLIQEGMPEDGEVIAQEPDRKEREPEEKADAEAPSIGGDTGYSLSQLANVGAHAELQDGVAKDLIAQGLVKETTTGGLMLLPEGRRALDDWRQKRHENVINVGLDIGGKKDALSTDRVKEELGKLGVEVIAEERVRSNTENTMVATLSRPLTPKELNDLSVVLDQEAIGGRWGDTGVLEGPNAAGWGGAFLPSEFREPKAPRPKVAAKPSGKPAKAKPIKLDVGKALKEQAQAAAEAAKEQPAPAQPKSPILEPEKVTSLERAPRATPEDIQTLTQEYEKSPEAFDLRTAEIKANIAQAEVDNPAARQALEAALDVRTKVRAEQQAIIKAQQENEAYARREAAKAKQEAKKERELAEMIRAEKDAKADEAIALAEFLNKQEADASSPGVLAAALKGAYASLEKREAAAMDRLRAKLDRPVQGQLFDLGGALAEGSKLYADLVEVGALKIAKGLVRFADWSAEMVDQFGKRITPHLQRLYAASREAAKDAVGISHRKIKSGARKGEIVAAPPGAKTTPKVTRLRNDILKKLAVEGEPGRFWYERSGKAVLDALGGDVQQARLFAGLLALYSAGTALAPNTTTALKVWNQWQAGEPIKGATADQNKKAEQWLETGIEPKGLKVSNFYNNLMREIDPKNYDVGQGATIDLWMQRAFGYERDRPTDAQYVFAQTEIKKLAKALGWEPQQAQAAIWVAIKARWEMIREAGRRDSVRKGYAELVPEGKEGRIILKPKGEGKVAAANQRKTSALFRKLALRVASDEVKKAVQSTKADYLDELAKHAAIVSWGSTPSSKVGQTLLDATFAEKLEFQAEIERIMINPDTGRELLAEWLGIIGNESFSGIGAWDMNIGATKQDVLLAPPAPKGETGVDAGAKRLLSAYASMVGWLLKLDAVSWHRPMFTAGKGESNGVDVDLGRQLSAQEVEAVYGAVYQRLRDTFGISHEQALEYAPVPTQYGFRVMNFNDVPLQNRKRVPNYNRKKSDPDFHDVVNEALNEVFPLDDIKVEYFGALGELAQNDWARNTDGESYASRISQAKNPKVWETFERAKRELAPRIEAARARLEERILARQQARERELDAPVSLDRIFAGGADAVAETFGRFGKLTGRDTNAEQKIYDLSLLIENPGLVQAVADAYGYKVEYFSFESNPDLGVEFRLPQLKKKGYKDGFVWIYDPRNSHGSFKGAVEYTRAWRVSHEIAHGITERFMQAKYGDSKRYGRLGREMEVVRGAEGKQVKVTERALTLKEAQRAVEWEDVTFRAQRMILEQMGVKITDSQFAQENNINLADAFYRVLTGDFGNPGDFGFVPSTKAADIRGVLVALESAEQQLAKDQGREATAGADLSSWRRVTDAEIADAVARARQDGMGQSPAGIEATIDAPRVTLAQSGMAIPRKPSNTIRFRNFRPSETTTGDIRKLKVKPETAKLKGEIAMADEFIVDVPLSQLYNATKDPKALRGNKTQAQFEADIVANGYAGFYQTSADGKPKGSVSLFESALVAGMQASINRVALDAAAPPKTKSPKLTKDNPGGNWLEGKKKQTEEAGFDERGMPERFGTVTGSLSAPVLMPIDLAASIPGMQGEQQNVRQDSLDWLKNSMDATGRLPMRQDGKAEYVPFVQVDQNGNAWVNEGNHRIMAAKELGWTHIPVEVRWFNGGEAVDGKFAPAKLLEGHEAMAEQPRLPESKTKVNKLLKRWAQVTKSLQGADRGAGLVMVPGAEGTVHLATVRPATAISVEALTMAIQEADIANVALTLSPASFGKRSAGDVVRSREWSILSEAGFRFDREANQLVRPSGQTAMFSISRGTNHGKGISMSEAKGIAEMMRHQFPRAWTMADIVAVESWEKLPAEIRRGTPDGFSKAGQVEAVFYDPGPLDRPQIFLIANNTGSRGEAITAVIHEIVGHYGVRSVLGAGYQNYMDSVWQGFEREAREAAARNGIKDIDHKDDIRRQDARNKAAEEFIAYLAGEIVSGNKLPPAQIGFWEKILRAFRQALARFGLVDVGARDIAHLINSAERYARGSLFSARESRRRDIMMAQAVPEFYSQMMKYIEDKLPNSATAQQYLEQLKAAQRKGEFKKEEFEVASVDVLLNMQDDIRDIPFEMWHKDDRKRITAKMEKLHSDGLISKDQMDLFYESGALGPVHADGATANLTTKDTTPSKLTKAALLHIIGTHAANMTWQMVGEATSGKILRQDLSSVSGERLVKVRRATVETGQSTREIRPISQAGEDPIPLRLQSITESHIAAMQLPLAHESAKPAIAALESFNSAVARLHKAEVFPTKRDIINDGVGSLYPTSTDAGIDGDAAQIFDAIRAEFIRDHEAHIAKRLAEAERLIERAGSAADVDKARKLTSHGIVKDFWDAHGKVWQVSNDVLRSLIDRAHPSVAGLVGELSAREFLSRRARLGDTPVEIVAFPEASTYPDWGSFNFTYPKVFAINTVTGEKTGEFSNKDSLAVAEMIKDIHHWGDGIEPGWFGKVHGTRWGDYSLSRGVNQYQEWLLIDKNPAGRQYKKGHWPIPNAAHLRSGFIIDEGTGRYAPIALEIQSDTGQAWQKNESGAASVRGVIDFFDNSSDSLSKALTAPDDRVVGKHNRVFKETGPERDFSTDDPRSIFEVAILRLFEDMIPAELGAGRSIAEIADAIDDALNESVAASHFKKAQNMFSQPGGKVSQFAHSLHNVHKAYYIRREKVVSAMETIGSEVTSSSGVNAAIAASQRMAVKNNIAVLERVFNKYGADGSTKFATNILRALSKDDGLEVMREAAADLSSMMDALIVLASSIDKVAMSKLSMAGVAEAKRDLADALKGVYALIDNAYEVIATTSAIGTEIWYAGQRRAGANVIVPWNLAPALEWSRLKMRESNVSRGTGIDYLVGDKDLISQAPSHAKTTSHQLAAIKKLVAQAVEHDLPYVFFATGEHSMKVAAGTGSVIESENTFVRRVRFPFEDWAEAVYEVAMSDGPPKALDSLSEEEAKIVVSFVREIIRLEEEYDVGNLIGELSKEEALKILRETTTRMDVPFSFMKDGSSYQKQLGLTRGDYAFVYYIPDSIRGIARVWEGDVAEIVPDDGSTITAIFPVNNDGSISDKDEVISQLGFEGLAALNATRISWGFERLPEGVEMRVNWTNPNTGLMENLDDFDTPRGLRYAYNVILPTVVKKFAKSYGAKVSLRDAMPASQPAGTDINEYDESAVQEDLRTWRQEGVMVQRSADGFALPKLMALEITDKMREEVRTTGFPMFSVRNEVRAEVMGDEITGTGLKFRDFFSDVTRGERQQPTNIKGYAPAIKTTDSTKAFASIRQKYSGNFENHIMTSIPGYREAQDAIFVAITNTLGEAGGTVLDIGASEGAALKAIAQANPKIKGVALDPNPAMRDTFIKKGGTKNVDYALAAFGTAKDAGKDAWVEDDGTKIKFFDPKGQTFDFIYEGMVFQFISNERKAQLGRAKEMLAPDGVLVIQEKFGGPKAQYDANEAKKDAYKALYYTPEQLEAKKQEVLQTGGDAVEGMTDLQVSVAEIEAVLGGLFKNVVQIWDSGNFKGYAASDSPQKLAAFTQNLQPLDSDYATTGTPRVVSSEGDVMFSIRTGKTGNSLFDSFASKVGPFGPTKTLRDIWNSFTSRWKDRTIAATLDIFHGQKIAEEAMGLSVDEMGYVSMRLAAGSDAVVRAALEYGVPIWKEGTTSIDETAGGFLDILAPLAGNADKLRAWELWMIARRAERLKAEGREKLFDIAEIREVQAEVLRRGWTQEFIDIADRYGAWKAKLLDFAQEAGIINPTTRPLWENADHIPFYRVLEGDLTGPFSGGAIADVKQQIQRLRGSDKAIGDPMQNIFMNMASLIDASMRNHAARLSIKNLDGSGLVTKHPQFQITQAAIPLDQLRGRLRAAGVDSATMDAAGLRGIESLTAIEAPTGANVVSFMEDGKRFYYEVHDPLVLIALKGVHPNPWSKMMALLRAPKRIFTQSITLDPVFMARNWFRDMFHAFALGRDGAIPVVPGYDSARGAMSSLRKDPRMIQMMAGGGAFDSGYVNANDPSGMAKIIRGRLSAAGLVTNMVTGKVKTMFEFYRDVSSSIENSHRVMVFEKSRKANKSLKAASYEARDLMDFSMRGAHPLIRFLAETVPFWNARMQGLYRTFRVSGPGAAGKAAGLAVMGMALRGALLTLASVALFFRNREDERWKELNDYEKNMYYHFFDVFEPGDHYALPKPFEIGALFSTVPEIIAEGMLSEEPDAGRAAARQFYHMVTEALNFSPDVQAIMPIAELAMNRDTFRDSPILTDYDKQLMPEDQDHYRLSPSIRSLAHAMPDFAPDAIRSPKQLNHIVLGYTGTLGSYALGMADAVWWRLNEEEAGLPPEKRPDEIPGVRSFVRNQPRKYPRSLSTMYDVLEDADRVYNSMRRAEKEELYDRAELLEEENLELIIAREAMDSARNEIRDLNKEIREIHIDKEMSPAEKRKAIDELLEIRNQISRDVYDWRPGGRENIEVTEGLKRQLEGGDFTGMTKGEQVDKLESLGLPWTADLVRSVSLSRREIASLAEAGG